MQTVVSSEITAPPFLLRAPRRRSAHSQSDIARALRAAKQVDPEFGIRLEPDGGIIIGRFPGQGKPTPPSAPVRDFIL